MKIAYRCFPILLLLFSVLVASFSLALGAQLLGSDADDPGDPGANDHPHNFSSTSSASIQTNAEDRICVFCHTPHGASTDGPLWNRADARGPDNDYTFPLYTGAEVDLTTYGDYGVGTYPNGSSRLCMSCHDGVTAISEVINSGDNITLGNLTTLGSSAIIDLSGSHPISFKFSEAISDDAYGPARFDLTDILPTILDGDGYFQCTGCHDPHNDTFTGTYDLPMWRNYSGNDTTDYNETCGSCHTSYPATPPAQLHP